VRQGDAAGQHERVCAGYRVEFGRKVLFSTERPTFAELESHVKQARAK